jgi:hypothetical protein
LPDAADGHEAAAAACPNDSQHPRPDFIEPTRRQVMNSLLARGAKVDPIFPNGLSLSLQFVIPPPAFPPESPAPLVTLGYVIMRVVLPASHAGASMPESTMQALRSRGSEAVTAAGSQDGRTDSPPGSCTVKLEDDCAFSSDGGAGISDVCSEEMNLTAGKLACSSHMDRSQFISLFHNL